MTSKVEAYKCDFCRRIYSRNYSANNHEKICFKNPNRQLKKYQLATFDTMPNNLKMINSYGVPGSDWLEPKEKRYDALNDFETSYEWWPKDEDGELLIGYYWDGEWKKIEGYKPPTFEPGYCWKDEIIPDSFYETHSIK